MDIGIGLDRDTEKVKEIVDIYFNGKNIDIKAYDDSRYIFHIDNSKKKGSIKESFYDQITNIILDIIFNIYSKEAIRKRIENIPKNLKLWEKKKIADICKSLLLDENSFTIEKKQIYDKIKAHIQETSTIWIDGFIQFRLKQFDVLLNLLVEKSIKEFKAEKEYEEFIKVLRYFVEVQEPKYNLVNLVFKDGYYELYDEMNDTIDKDIFKEVIKEIGSENVSKDDLLISTLIVTAPRRLRIHLNKKDRDTDVVKIIINVFQDRVYFCYGCNKCNKSTKIKGSQ